MRLLKHQLDEELAIKLLGWKWMSFIGTPVKSEPGYPEERRVRQLMSAKALKSEQWKQHLEEHEGREATGDEPLAYAYCSSQGLAALPIFTILVDERD